MVTTLGAALAAAAVVLVAFWASLMTTLCAETPLAVATVFPSVSAATPAPAPPPIRAPATRPATPSRQRPARRAGAAVSAGAPDWNGDGNGGWKAGGGAPVPCWLTGCWATYPGV